MLCAGEPVRHVDADGGAGGRAVAPRLQRGEPRGQRVRRRSTGEGGDPNSLTDTHARISTDTDRDTGI